MKTNLVPIPKDCAKYYRSCTLEEVVSSGVGTKEEVESLEYFISMNLERVGSQFLGWARCKDKYSEYLVKSQIGLVQIAQDQDGTKYLVDITGSGINILSRNTLDVICNQN